MAVAVALLLIVLAELVVSVFCLSRLLGVVRELRVMEDAYSSLSKVLGTVLDGLAGDELPVELPKPDESREAATLAAANEVLANASEQDLAAAADMLRRLGIGG